MYDCVCVRPGDHGSSLQRGVGQSQLGGTCGTGAVPVCLQVQAGSDRGGLWHPFSQQVSDREHRRQTFVLTSFFLLLFFFFYHQEKVKILLLFSSFHLSSIYLKKGVVGGGGGGGGGIVEPFWVFLCEIVQMISRREIMQLSNWVPRLLWLLFCFVF